MGNMKRDALRVFVVVAGMLVLFAFILPSTVAADKSSVSIEAPATATTGDTIIIRITVRHDSNNFLHYTNWLSAMIDNKEIARWDYSWRRRPEGATFTKEITHLLTEPIEIKAEAHCNIHGSAGPEIKKVSLANNQ